MSRLDNAEDVLKKAGLRMTSTRHAILSLLSKTSKFLTVEQVSVQSGERKIDTVTVYRIMQKFEELAIVKKLLSVNAYITSEEYEGEEKVPVYLIDVVSQEVAIQYHDLQIGKKLTIERAHLEFIVSGVAEEAQEVVATEKISDAISLSGPESHLEKKTEQLVVSSQETNDKREGREDKEDREKINAERLQRDQKNRKLVQEQERIKKDLYRKKKKLHQKLKEF